MQNAPATGEQTGKNTTLMHMLVSIPGRIFVDKQYQ